MAMLMIHDPIIHFMIPAIMIAKSRKERIANWLQESRKRTQKTHYDSELDDEIKKTVRELILVTKLQGLRRQSPPMSAFRLILHSNQTIKMQADKRCVIEFLAF